MKRVSLALVPSVFLAAIAFALDKDDQKETDRLQNPEDLR
jgi:hypothetical protein